MPVVRVGRPQERLATNHAAVSGSTKPGELDRQNTKSVMVATLGTDAGRPAGGEGQGPGVGAERGGEAGAGLQGAGGRASH
jgi:hypothetical protein